MDQMHLEETVHYLAMESGSWTGDENTMVQAGTNEIEGDMYSARTFFDLGCAVQMVSDKPVRTGVSLASSFRSFSSSKDSQAASCPSYSLK